MRLGCFCSGEEEQQQEQGSEEEEGQEEKDEGLELVQAGSCNAVEASWWV
jgi:hypothetical protein